MIRVAHSNISSRVLLVEPFGGYKGHYNQYSSEIARNISTMGFQTTLVTREQFSGNIGDQCRLECFQEHQLPVLSRYPLASSIANELGLLKRAFILANTERPNVIHFLSFRPPSLAFAFLLWGRNLRQDVMTMATLHPGRMFEDDHLSRKSWLVVRQSLNLLINRQLHYLMISGPVTRERMVSLLHLKPSSSAKVRVVPYGTDLPFEQIDKSEARRRLGIASNNPIILLFGSFNLRRSYDTVFQAVTLLKDKWPNLGVLVAGAQSSGGLTEHDIREMADRYGCGSRLIMHEGYVKDELIPVYYIASDIVAVLYRQNYDMSGPLLLACTYGRPVIATESGDIGQTTRKWQIGLTARPDAPDTVASSIDTILQWRQPKLEEVMNNCKALAVDWCWRNVARAFSEYYSSAAHSKS